jgi:hypothetical protein
MSRLGLGLGLIKGGGIRGLPFNPLSYDPSIYFNADDSMLSAMQNPTLDLDPSVPSSLDIITATRASTATVTDASGNIVDAAPNTVRVDHVDGVPMILVEPSATNLVEYSDDFSNAAWGKLASGTGVVPIVTPNYTISPDGTQNASRIVFNTGSGTSSSNRSVVVDGAVTASGVNITGSVYLKGPVGGETILVRGVGANAYTTITLTSEWVRYVFPEISFDTSSEFEIGLRQGIAGAINSAITVYVWGAQLESGSIATSYIPTSGSTVTRAADDLVISGSDFTDFYNQSEGTIYTEAMGRQVGLNYLFSANNGTADERIYSLFEISSHLAVVDGGTSQAAIDAGTCVVDQINRISGSWKVNDVRAALDGAAGATDTAATMPTVDRLNIGGNRSNSYILNGHIKRMIYWPVHSSRLSSDFLTQVTGISTSGDVLAEIELKADNLDLVPVLRNLGQGASNATQDTALNQPIAHVPVNGGHLYLSGVAGSYAQIATPLTIGTNDNFRIEVGINTNGGNFNLITGVSSASRISFYNGVFFFGSQQVTCSQPASGQSVLVVERISAVISIYQNAVLLGAAGATTSTMDMYRIGAAMGFATSIPTLEGTISYFKASVAGTPVLDIDFSKAPHAATTFTPTVGGTVTINQSGNDPATIVRRPFLRFDGVNSKMSGLFDSTITGGTFFMVARGRATASNAYYFNTKKLSQNTVIWRYAPSTGFLRTWYKSGSRLNHAATNSGIGHLVTHTKLTDVGEASLNGEFLTDSLNPEVNSEAYTISDSGDLAADIEHMSFFPVGSRINTRTNTRAMLTYLEGKYPATTIVEPPLNPTFELIPTGESIVAIKTRSLVQGSDGKLYGAPYSGSFDVLLRVDPVTGAVDYSQSTAGISTNTSKWIGGFKLNDGRTFYNAHGATAGNLIVDASTNPPTLSAMGQTFYEGNPVGGQHRGGLQASNGFIYQSNYTAAKGFSKLDPADGLYKTSPVYAVNTDGPLYSSNLPLAESSQHYRQWGLCEDPVSGIIFGTPVGGDRIVYHNPDPNVNTTVQGDDLLTGNVPPPTSTSSDYFMKYTGDGIYSPISQRIYCFPRRANAILVINPADKSAIEIPTPDELNDPVLQKSFAAVMGGDGCIYSVPWGVPYLFRIDPRNHEIRTWNIQDIFTAAGGQLGVGWWTAGMAVGNEIWYAPGGAHDVLKVSLNYGFDSGFGAGFK